MTSSKMFRVRLTVPWLIRLAVLVSVLLWLSGCMASLKPSAAATTGVSPPVMPALPSNARQPMRGSSCLPTCIENLTKQREDALRRLKATEPQG